MSGLRLRERLRMSLAPHTRPQKPQPFPDGAAAYPFSDGTLFTDGTGWVDAA